MKRYPALWAALMLVMMACEQRHKLYLHGDEDDNHYKPKVQIDLNVMWQYHIDYNWENEWTFGQTDAGMGEWGYKEPEAFEMRAYFIGSMPDGRHQTVDGYYVTGKSFRSSFGIGYYNILTWNEIATDQDGVQSIWIDEESTLDSVMAYTNPAMRMGRYEGPGYGRAHYMPEELFAAYKRNLHISSNPADYDHFDEASQTYSIKANAELHPVTYIYLTQVRLHNNRGRVDNVDGTATLSGMARGVCLNSGIATPDAISVSYYVDLRRNCIIPSTGEKVDIVGGRCVTFGIPNQNSAIISRAEDVRDPNRHYLDINMVFNNGMDSTFVFDVTDSIQKYYKGGVITIDLNIDNIKIPSRSGGSAFDAVVKEYEEVFHEFEI